MMWKLAAILAPRRGVRKAFVAVSALLATGLPGAIPLIDCQPVVTIEPTGAFALQMPSAATVLPGGDWAVLDGVNDRIVVTDATGQGQRLLGQGILSGPLGLTLGPDDNLWIADTGNARVAVLSPEGDLVREIAVPEGGATEYGPDPVDLVFADNGRRLLVVDNDNHRVLPWERNTERWGEPWRGTEGTPFNYPFSIAVGPQGERAVVDVINSRIVVRDPAFDFTYVFGNWGVDAGEIYRPKGLAFDRRGRLMVSDSVLGAIQVFTDDGDLIGVLADGDVPRQFVTPTRLSIDEQGHLAVVEMRANRVSVWEIGR
jgi:sugar lactone lactonase YvrE